LMIYDKPDSSLESFAINVLELLSFKKLAKWIL